MTGKPVIRETAPEEITQVLALYPQAFPEEELRPVVSALLNEGPEVLSLAAFDGEALLAHVLFTRCATEAQDPAGALLGPLGVVPSRQKQGLGSAIVLAGMDRLETAGIRQVFVLGDPAFYRRFGFSTERQVLTPWPLPAEYGDGAWQSMPLADRPPLAAGRLSLPEPWMDRALW